MKKILIIDDDVEIVNLFIEGLQNQNYDAIGETDGRKAFDRVQQEMPDLVILDILLPYIHGFSICKKIKENEATKDIKIIFVSAKSFDSDIKSAYDIGADHFISKPFKLEEVNDKIEELLSEN